MMFFLPIILVPLTSNHSKTWNYMDLLNDMKSGNHDMKTKNKQNPGNKQKLAFGQFCLLPGLEIMHIQKT